jgi:hypothetical protein
MRFQIFSRWPTLLCAAALTVLAGCAAQPAAQPAPAPMPTATAPVYATASAQVSATAAPPGSAAHAAGPLQLTLLHTNDTLGYVLPCG